jgi:hypothetical protein
MIKGDSEEYDLLEKWADFDCEGHYSCEIGVRQGLGSKIIMDNVKNNKTHIGVDPYGNLSYQHYDRKFTKAWPERWRGEFKTDYTDEMRDTLLNDFKEYRNEGKFILANMTDTMFMCHPDWNEKTYAFVHFDGPHMSKDVMTEAVWFANRAAPRARFVFDDTDKFEMSVVAYAMELFGFKTETMGEKKCLLARSLK